jgi:adenosine 3'-phospho 5'-phosphosulfate transporter B2
MSFIIAEKNFLYSIVKACFGENEKYDLLQTASTSKSVNKALVRECVLLSYCFVGLMGSYLTWGVLQEKIMTREYVDENGKKSFFKDSQFLVFSNRLLAFCIAIGYLYLKQQTRHRAPLFKYSYASFSNVLSAWLQYEALKFISFPTQVLAKSCKLVPVMIMVIFN